ncbi:MAG: protoglobin domain-containing protein, partial [Dongiaceae bacterium]
MSKIDTDLDLKIEFLKMDKNSREALRGFREIVKSHLGKVLDGFYGHVGAIRELRDLLGSDSNIARVKELQSKHWLSLFSAEFDHAYRDNVKRIGDAHFRNKLSPSWYMGG